MKRIAVFISTAGPFGYCPVASGSAGTMAAVPLAVAMSCLSWKWQAGIIVALYFVFVWAASIAEEHFGRKDPGEVVSDEVLGYLIAMFAMPPDSAHIALAYILFRAFDVAKPWPIRWLDKKLPAGWGIVSDDAAAGIVTQILLRLIFHFFF